jgi:hypothetical protein
MKQMLDCNHNDLSDVYAIGLHRKYCDAIDPETRAIHWLHEFVASSVKVRLSFSLSFTSARAVHADIQIVRSLCLSVCLSQFRFLFLPVGLYFVSSTVAHCSHVNQDETSD